MADSFKVISSRLFIPNVSIDTSVSGSSSQIFSLSKWNMLTFRVLIALSKPKIYDVNIVLAMFLATYEKVVWLNISVNDSFLMHLLYSLYLFKILSFHLKRDLPFKQRFKEQFSDRIFFYILERGLLSSFRASP